MPEPLERLKVLINSSTPIVIIETMEESRAVRLSALPPAMLSFRSLNGTLPMASSEPEVFR